MAEKSICSNANYFSIDKYTPHPWICRDDDGDYWTIVEETDNDLAIYKSEDAGDTWVLKKTLTNADFTGNPFPLDDWQIINLENDDAVYITLRKGTALYSWEIETLTDTGAKDLDNDIPADAVDHPMYIRWDIFNSKLYGFYEGGTYMFNIWIKRDGTFGANVRPFAAGVYPLDAYIDSNGIKCYLSYNYSGGANEIQIQSSTGSKGYSAVYANIKFANVIGKYNDDMVIAWYESGLANEIQIRVLDGTNLSNELLDTEVSLDTVPLSMFVTVDGDGNIYVIYTDGTDKEAYYLRYDGSWGSPVKISSDNDGELVMPELRPPIADNKILVTYSATS